MIAMKGVSSHCKKCAIYSLMNSPAHSGSRLTCSQHRTTPCSVISNDPCNLAVNYIYSKYPFNPYQKLWPLFSVGKFRFFYNIIKKAGFIGFFLFSILCIHCEFFMLLLNEKSQKPNPWNLNLMQQIIKIVCTQNHR